MEIIARPYAESTAQKVIIQEIDMVENGRIIYRWEDEKQLRVGKLKYSKRVGAFGFIPNGMGKKIWLSDVFIIK